MRAKVILYNPRAVFWTMPLALIAIGSALDPSKYDVVIVDGRLESEPINAIVDLLDDSVICLGITVLTGAPLRDALTITRQVAEIRPGLPIVWGGWHPSLFPDQCLAEPGVNAVVVGQGEETFSEVVDRLARKASLEGVRGCVYRPASHWLPHSSHPVALLASPPGDGPSKTAHNPARPFSDVNKFPAHNYALVDVERYFGEKARLQFDYISSQGCRFRCTFCADPAVYRRAWSGLVPERIARELIAHHSRYGFEEIAFQDETFFTSRDRVEAIADAFLAEGLAVDWTATMRSDQGARLDDGLMAKCKRAGLRRVIMGVESGSPEMLKRIKKDITILQVLDSAKKCAEHGIGAILNFIVGFPGETADSLGQTLDMAARLRAMSPDFEVSIFYFRPYPGNPIADELMHSGFELPDTLEEWADFDYVAGHQECVTQEQWRLIERFKFYQRYAFGHNRRIARWPLHAVSRWRVNRRFYSFPLEKMIVERLRPAQKLS